MLSAECPRAERDGYVIGELVEDDDVPQQWLCRLGIVKVEPVRISGNHVPDRVMCGGTRFGAGSQVDLLQVLWGGEPSAGRGIQIISQQFIDDVSEGGG